MDFATHSDLKGQHAFLSPSNYHWVNYDLDKLRTVYRNSQATEMGTKLHELASTLIELGIKLPKTQVTLNMFVNDAIRFGLTSEQVLYYSPNCFGTADAIGFRNSVLRISDFKSGETPASMMQLKVYAAIFCLEYDIEPELIKTVLRIYQTNNILEELGEPQEIREIMRTIVEFDEVIERLR